MNNLLWLIVAAFFSHVAAIYEWGDISPLDEYVARDDSYYTYNLVQVYDCGQYELHFINMTSQKWLNESVTSAPIWWHHVTIAIPKSPRHLDAFHLFINGGRMGDSFPSSCTSDGRTTYLGDFAVNTGAVAAQIRQCPNQPLYFTDTPTVPREEDQIMARTWRYYIEEIIATSDVTLPVPMVKAAKKAVDTIIEYTSTVNSAYQLTKVMPAGYSKRGWTTWLLGCVDPRVFAMVPIVLDIGTAYENMQHHQRAYGGWSAAIYDYYNENITRYLHHPRTQEIFSRTAIDFMNYNPRLTMPKLVIHGSGDEFFLPDDPWYFFTRLTTPKYLLLLENTNHDLDIHYDKINRQMMNFFEASLNKSYVWPQIAWSRSEGAVDGSLQFWTNTQPLSITSWWGDTVNRTCELVEETRICRRDFRLETYVPEGPNPIVWQEQLVTDLGNGNYRVQMQKPAEGFRGFFITVAFPGSRNGDNLYFTSEVQIIPDVLPYPTCTTSDECHNRIV